MAPTNSGIWLIVPFMALSIKYFYKDLICYWFTKLLVKTRSSYHQMSRGFLQKGPTLIKNPRKCLKMTINDEFKRFSWKWRAKNIFYQISDSGNVFYGSKKLCRSPGKQKSLGNIIYPQETSHDPVICKLSTIQGLLVSLEGATKQNFGGIFNLFRRGTWKETPRDNFHTLLDSYYYSCGC